MKPSSSEQKSLSEDVELTVLSRESKQRKDSLHEFDKAGRQDLVDKVACRTGNCRTVYAETTFRRRVI